jgi:hypothetical protein
VAKHRKSNGKCNAENVTSALAREEKRREEIYIPPNPQGDGGHKRQRRKDETPYHEIVEAYREALPELPQPTGPDNWTEQRRRTVRARWDESPERQSIEWWQRFFGYVARSAFLTGKTPQAFEASFDWLLKPGNLTKVLEGNYHKVLNHG